MAVPNNAVLRVVASMLLPENVIAQNVFYLLFEDTGTSNDELDVVDDIAEYIEAVYTTMTGRIDDALTLTGIKVYIYDSGDADWDEVGDAVIDYDFTGSGDMVPHGVAGLIHAKTTNPDVQAAKFLPGIIDTQVVEGIITAATMASMVLFAVEWTEIWVGTITGADFGPGVWSTAKTAFLHFSGVEVINAIPGYQRRRKPGVGI